MVEDGVKESPPLSQQKVIVRLERKRRGGKTVTVIEGLTMPAREREALLKRLKAGLGTGGAVRMHHLRSRGITVTPS